MLAGVPSAWAGGVQVVPIRVDISAAHPIATMTVSNFNDAPMVMQLESMSWLQRDGKDQYVATDELLAVPPIFKIAPGSEQLVRVGLRQPPDPTREWAYRLFLTEVPAPLKFAQNGIQVRLQLIVPVFVAPVTKGSANLQVSGARQISDAEDDKLSFTLVNNGTVHIRAHSVQALSSTAPDSKPLAEVDGGYLLAGTSRNLSLSLPPHARALSVRVISDDEKLVLPVSPGY
jgi:fimbrial chaperone protein